MDPEFQVSSFAFLFLHRCCLCFHVYACFNFQQHIMHAYIRTYIPAYIHTLTCIHTYVHTYIHTMYILGHVRMCLHTYRPTNKTNMHTFFACERNRPCIQTLHFRHTNYKSFYRDSGMKEGSACLSHKSPVMRACPRPSCTQG